jgi:hypothetical protein
VYAPLIRQAGCYPVTPEGVAHAAHAWAQ